LIYAEKAKKIQDSTHDVKGLVITNTTIANVYNNLDQHQKAINIYLENLKLISDENPTKAGIHFYLATAYLNLKKYNDAEKHFKKAKEIAVRFNFPSGIAIANSSIGNLKIEEGEIEEGINYLEDALVFFIKNEQSANIAHCYIVLAKGYAKLENTEEAIKYNTKAISIFKKQNTLKALVNAYSDQSNFFTNQKNFKEANKFLKLHYKIKDSIFSDENIRNINELQTKYETNKITLEKEIEVAKNKKNRLLLFLTLLISGILFLAGLLYFNWYRTKTKTKLILTELKETQKRLGLEKQYKDSELKALKAQMNPHFIFNVLNSIQDYIVLNQKNLASDYLGKFADLIRNYLHYSDIGFISISEELKNLNLYLELEKLRFEDNLNYTITIADHINGDAIFIPTMIIQPYIENALKHGLLHLKTNRILNISMDKISDNILECVIKDNGVGRKKADEINSRIHKTHKSFALKATSERLDLLNFGKDKKIGVTFIDLLDESNNALGTKVILKIPITKK